MKNLKESDKKSDKLRVIFLGGVEEVGRNMTVLEFKNDIIVIDAGLQFPEEDMPGIDYIIPNINYLKKRKEKIKGIVITHGHYDHIGAIPYIIDKIGNPPIFASPLSQGIILKRQEEFSDLPKIKIVAVKTGEKIKLGAFEIEFFHQNHNIPDSFGLFIKTPVGNLVHTGDFKFDLTPIYDKPVNFSKIAEIGNRKILALMSESTNADAPGHSLSEKTIMENLDNIFRKVSGRIIAATFSSLISRIQQLIHLAEKYHRYVAIEGYSMKNNVEITKALGYLKISRGTLIPIKEINNYPPSKILILCTGAQGEDKAILMRIANKEHRYIQIQKNDTVIFSSSVIPGNERAVQALKDLLTRQNAKIFHYKMMDIHAGGHAHQEDLKMMINLIKPKFFIPIHGNHYMLKLHADLAKEMKIPSANIFVPENGSILEINKYRAEFLKEKAPSNYVMVDGLGIGDVGEIVLRDRQVMARDGMFVVIVVVDAETGKVRGEPDIISRGFVYLRESKELLTETRKLIKNTVKKSIGVNQSINSAYIKNNLRDQIGEYLYSKTKRRPMVLPVVIEI